jgi:hypothetical protein
MPMFREESCKFVVGDQIPLRESEGEGGDRGRGSYSSAAVFSLELLQSALGVI